jgi:hypothetical protein
MVTIDQQSLSTITISCNLSYLFKIRVRPFSPCLSYNNCVRWRPSHLDLETAFFYPTRRPRAFALASLFFVACLRE